MSFSLTPTGLVLKAAGYYRLRSYTAMLFVLSTIAAVAIAKSTCKSPFEPKQRCSVTEGLYGQNYSPIQISEFRCFNQFQGPRHADWFFTLSSARLQWFRQRRNGQVAGLAAPVSAKNRNILLLLPHFVFRCCTVTWHDLEALGVVKLLTY